MRIAVVGATGMVGQIILKVLAERSFPVTELIPVASQRSVGKSVQFGGRDWTIQSLEAAVALAPDVALFSAGGETSLEWAPKFAAAGTRVVDNSSAWRMDPDKKLIVPEINADKLTAEDYIIANPNCSTIQLVMALHPLHQAFGAKRVIVSTYQSVTGTGKGAVDQLEGERNGEDPQMVYPYKIDRNCIPHCDIFLENDYTKEEMKMTQETVKIIGDAGIKLSATAVRVPVQGGHSESVNVEFER
ncbi:MAG: aspartate-semialdehyde dehydrogenase, partial [Cryomorphaceae bacterium]|nr:aspartate-semialdehyde dehydrogenase [Cryomorphaceae bacterium]